jgi:hypothetical protein
LGIHGSFEEELVLPMRPHLVEFVFVFVYAVASSIALQNVVEPPGSHIIALCDHCLGHLLTFFAVFEDSIFLELSFEGLDCAGVEYVHDAGVQDLVECDGIVSAVVENFQDVAVDESVADDLFGEF